jgi:hypothetical protein
MSNNKQSSVEYLLENLHFKDSLKWAEVIEQAKAMHKEEIINATIYGNRFQGCYGLYSEQYYNETYGGNK